jgi:2-polyprenyl-6-methoxyphenol hydroxylase-like FAD-dependent oxidoreductase
MDDRIEHTTVVIVGAGPTGLTAAVRLAQLGIPYVLLDAAPAPTSTSNAALVHASTLEILAELGLGDALVAAGRRMDRIVMVDRGRPLVRVSFTNLPSRYAFALGVPQSTTEELLLRRLAELAGSVRRRHRVRTVRAHGDVVVVTGTVESPGEPVPFEIRARYVIGADGSRSAVRAAVGLDFPGDTYPSQFVLADVALTADGHADDEATINMSAHGVTVLARLPSGNHRIVATVAAEADVPARPDRAFVDALLRDRGIHARPAAEPVWSSAFRVHHRVAERFRVGRVFLAGDAAHIHSPAAGQGMNTGIADAFDLATRLAAVVTGQAGEATLDAYDRQRRAVALEVLRFTDRLTRVAMMRNPVARLVRRAGAGTVGGLGPVQRRLAMWVTGLQRSPLRGDLPAVTPRPLEPRPSGDELIPAEGALPK